MLLLDATRGLEAQDLKIASLVLEEGRALIIAINKWDVAEDASWLFNGIRAALDEGLAQLRGVPLLTVSALTGKGLDRCSPPRSKSARPGRSGCRPARSTAGSRCRRRQSAAGAGRQADQAALHHPGQDPSAEAS